MQLTGNAYTIRNKARRKIARIKRGLRHAQLRRKAGAK